MKRLKLKARKSKKEIFLLKMGKFNVQEISRKINKIQKFKLSFFSLHLVELFIQFHNLKQKETFFNFFQLNLHHYHKYHK